MFILLTNKVTSLVIHQKAEKQSLARIVVLAHFVFACSFPAIILPRDVSKKLIDYPQVGLFVLLTHVVFLPYETSC